MEKKLLVVVYGISNSGKTTTLKELLKLLLIEKYVKQANIINIPVVGDIGPLFLEFTDKNGRKIKVGLSSEGDDKDIVDGNLMFFETQQCKIAFCAAKTYGMTVESIEQYIDSHSEFLLLPFYKVWKEDEGKGRQYACELAQEMLLQTKLRWNKLAEREDVFRFD